MRIAQVVIPVVEAGAVVISGALRLRKAFCRLVANGSRQLSHLRQSMCCVPQGIVLSFKTVFSVLKNMWCVVVHDGRIFTALGWVVARISCCGASSRKQSRERSNEDDLRHLELSVTQRSVLHQSNVILRQSGRHDTIHPQQKAGAENHVVQNNFLDQAKDFAERKDNVDSLVALAEALYAIDFAPS